MLMLLLLSLHPAWCLYPALKPSPPADLREAKQHAGIIIAFPVDEEWKNMSYWQIFSLTVSAGRACNNKIQTPAQKWASPQWAQGYVTIYLCISSHSSWPWPPLTSLPVHPHSPPNPSLSLSDTQTLSICPSACTSSSLFITPAILFYHSVPFHSYF